MIVNYLLQETDKCADKRYVLKIKSVYSVSLILDCRVGRADSKSNYVDALPAIWKAVADTLRQ